LLSRSSRVTSRWRTALPLALILLLSAGLRLWRLEAAPLWWDEGNNAYFAHQSLPGLVAAANATHDTDPPAHRLALGLWLRLVGDSAPAVRLFSVLLGVGTVLLLFRWACWQGGTRAGLLAAALGAACPLLIYYSREAKGYPFVTFFGLLATYLWARHLVLASASEQDGQERSLAHSRLGRGFLWGAYILCGALALGAHYYAVLLNVAQGAWLATDALVWRSPRPWRRIGPWLAAQGAIAVLLLPWVWATHSAALAGARQVPESGKALAALGYLATVGRAFAAGPATEGWVVFAAAAVLVAGFVIALWPRRAGEGDAGSMSDPIPRAGPTLTEGFGSRRFAAGVADTAARQQALALCLLFVPLVLGYAVQREITFFSPRFLLYALPAGLLLAACGLARLRWGGAALALALGVAWAGAVPATYTPYVGPEEDLRPAAQALSVVAQPGDGVIVSYIWQEGILRELAPVPGLSYHMGWFKKKLLEEQVGQLLAEHPRLWLVSYRVPLQHSQNKAGLWLEQHAARALVAESGAHRAVLYLLCPTPAPDHSATFAAGVQLAYALQGQEVRAGQPLSLALRWGVLQPAPRHLTVFLHLVDASGQPVAQDDGEPVNGLRPFASLKVGEWLEDARALLIPANLPAGRYRLLVGLYDADSGERDPLAQGTGDAVDLGEVLVARR
jgi:mannosyltransferase